MVGPGNRGPEGASGASGTAQNHAGNRKPGRRRSAPAWQEWRGLSVAENKDLSAPGTKKAKIQVMRGKEEQRKAGSQDGTADKTSGLRRQGKRQSRAGRAGQNKAGKGKTEGKEEGRQERREGREKGEGDDDDDGHQTTTTTTTTI